MIGIEILYGIITFIIGFIVIKRINKFTEKSFKKKMPTGMAKNSARLTYYILMFLLAMASLQVAGFKIESLLVAGGVIGMAIGFASQKTVSNLISGLFLYVDRPFDLGDSVDINGVGGVVEDIQPLSTKLRTWNGPIMRIPNEKVFGANITNYKQIAARRFVHKIRISYDSDIDKAMTIIKKIIDDEIFILKNPSPSVIVTGLLDSAIEIQIKAWTPSSKLYSVKTKILKTFYLALKKNKIKIPYNQLRVHLK